MSNFGGHLFLKRNPLVLFIVIISTIFFLLYFMLVIVFLENRCCSLNIQFFISLFISNAHKYVFVPIESNICDSLLTSLVPRITIFLFSIIFSSNITLIQIHELSICFLFAILLQQFHNMVIVTKSESGSLVGNCYMEGDRIMDVDGYRVSLFAI